MRLLQGNGSSLDSKSDASLGGLITKARKWWAILRKGEMDIATLAKAEKGQSSYVTRVVRLAFLSPAIFDAAISGKLKSGIDSKSLTLGAPIPASWANQMLAFLPS